MLCRWNGSIVINLFSWVSSQSAAESEFKPCWFCLFCAATKECCLESRLPRSRIAESYGDSARLKNPCAGFHSSCAILHSYLQPYKDPTFSKATIAAPCFLLSPQYHIPDAWWVRLRIVSCARYRLSNFLKRNVYLYSYPILNVLKKIFLLLSYPLISLSTWFLSACLVTLT